MRIPVRKNVIGPSALSSPLYYADSPPPVSTEDIRTCFIAPGPFSFTTVRHSSFVPSVCLSLAHTWFHSPTILAHHSRTNICSVGSAPCRNDHAPISAYLTLSNPLPPWLTDYYGHYLIAPTRSSVFRGCLEFTIAFSPPSSAPFRRRPG